MANAGNVQVGLELEGASAFQRSAHAAAQSLRNMAGGAKESAAALQKNSAAIRAGAKAGAVMAAAAVGVGVSIAKAAGAAGEFDQTLTKVGLVSGATAEELAQLRDTARQAGIETQFSPQAAAEGLLTLGQSGKTARQQMALLNPVLGLAAAGQISVADAAALANRSMSAFGIGAGEVGLVSDKLLKITQSLDINMGQISATFGKVAGKMGVYGQSFDTVAITLGLATAATGDAAVAQTALSTATASLQTKAKKLKAELGVDVFDKQTGAARQLDEVLLDMQAAMGDLGEEQKAQILTTFLGQRGILAYSAVANAAAGENLRGAEAIKFLRAETAKAAGTTEAFKKALQETYSGKVTLMMGSIETLVIEIGSAFKSVLMPAVSAVTWVLNAMILAMSKISQPVKTGVAAIVVGMAAAAAAVGTFLAAAGALGLALSGIKAGLASLKLILPIVKKGFVGMAKSALAAIGPLLVSILSIAAAVGIVLLVIGRLAHNGGEGFKAIAETANQAWAWISQSASSAATSVKESFRPVGEFFSSLFSGIWGVVRSVFSGVGRAIGSMLESLSKGMSKALGLYGELLFAMGKEEEAAALRGAIKDLRDFNAAAAGGQLWKELGEGVDAAADKLKGYAALGQKVGGEFFSGLTMQWRSNAGELAGTIRDELGKSLDGLSELFGDAVKKVGGAARAGLGVGVVGGKGEAGGIKPPSGAGAEATDATKEASKRIADARAAFLKQASKNDIQMLKTLKDRAAKAEAAAKVATQKKQIGGIGAVQALGQGSVAGIGQGVAAAMGVAMGPVAGAALGLVDSLMGASVQGKKFKDGLQRVFGALANALNPVFKALMPVIDLLQVLGAAIAPVVDVLFTVTLMKPALMIIGKVFQAIAIVVQNLIIGFRSFYIAILELLDALPFVDFTNEIRELERANAREVAARNDMIDRLMGEAEAGEELAGAARDAARELGTLNVPSGYKIANAAFRADRGVPQANDFISRPGQPVQRFSRSDTVVGFDGGGPIGTGGGGQTINVQQVIIQGVDDPADFWDRVADAVRFNARRGGPGIPALSSFSGS